PSPSTSPGTWAATARARAAGAGRSTDRRCWGSSRPRCGPWSGPRPVEAGAFGLSVQGQGAALAGGVGAGEDPVLPGGQPAEDLGLQGLGAGEAQRGLHAGQRVGRERGALLAGDAQLVLEVDLVRG